MALGRKTGGRTPGTPNKRTAHRKEAERLAKEYGTTPLEFMLALMADSKMPLGMRFQAAKDAAPYTHPKLASVTVKGDPQNPLHQTHTDLTAAELKQVATEVLKKV